MTLVSVTIGLIPHPADIYNAPDIYNALDNIYHCHQDYALSYTTHMIRSIMYILQINHFELVFASK